MVLLFANKTEKDIILHKQLQELKNRLTVKYMLDKAEGKWQGYTGYITEQILKEVCPLDDPDTLYAYCGPGVMNSYLKEMFQKYPQSTSFTF